MSRLHLNGLIVGALLLECIDLKDKKLDLDCAWEKIANLPLEAFELGLRVGEKSVEGLRVERG